MPKPIPGLRDPESPEVGPYELRQPQDETEQNRLQRRYYLERQLAYYEFSTQDDQPAFVKNLPEKEQFSKIRDRRMLRDLLISYADLFFVAFKWLRRPKGKLSDYDIFYLFREEPAVRDCFDSDLEFGRQRLAGLNPLYIRRCDGIPEQFDVDEETVAGLLDRAEQMLGTAPVGQACSASASACQATSLAEVRTRPRASASASVPTR